jgi:nucleoside-diphosphate-sugar epimerase
MARRHLVTGGAGFIGSHVVEALLARGEAVRVLDDLSTGRRENLGGLSDRVEVVEGDLRDPGVVAAAMRGVANVFHLGARTSVPRSIEDPSGTHAVNATGTLNVLIAARDAGVGRVVLSSSSSVYGNTPELPKREDMPARPLSVYAVSKLVGEAYASVFNRLHGVRTFCLRYFNVYGPRQDPASPYAAVVPRFMAAVREGRPMIVNGDGTQTRDFTFVTDVVAANLACVDAPDAAAGSVYNVAGGRRISVRELAERVAALAGRPPEMTFTPARAGDVRDSLADLGRSQELLGWRPQVGLDEGLERTWAWHRTRN